MPWVVCHLSTFLSHHAANASQTGALFLFEKWVSSGAWSEKDAFCCRSEERAEGKFDQDNRMTAPADHWIYLMGFILNALFLADGSWVGSLWKKWTHHCVVVGVPIWAKCELRWSCPAQDMPNSCWKTEVVGWLCVDPDSSGWVHMCSGRACGAASHLGRDWDWFVRRANALGWQT